MNKKIVLSSLIIIIAAGFVSWFIFFSKPTFSYKHLPPSRVINIFRKLPTIETERLILRKLTADDAGDVIEFRSDPEVARYLDWRIGADDKQQMETMFSIMELMGEQGKPIFWVMELKDTKKVIGYCGVADWVKDSAAATITSILSRDYWRKGYMTEAYKAIMPIMFDVIRLNKIKARIIVYNKASVGLFKSLGFKREARLREDSYIEGKYYDVYIYSLLRSEYIQRYKKSLR